VKFGVFVPTFYASASQEFSPLDPFVHLPIIRLPNFWTRYFENECTDFNANWHKWSAGQGYETANFGGLEVKGQGHTRSGRLTIDTRFRGMAVASFSTPGSSRFLCAQVNYSATRRRVSLSVFPSLKRCLCVKTKDRKITRFSLSGSPEDSSYLRPTFLLPRKSLARASSIFHHQFICFRWDRSE